MSDDMGLAELVRTERVFRRVDVFRLDGWPNEPARDSQPGLKPESVRIEMYRESEHRPWRVVWVTLSGRRIRKDGSLGSSQATQMWGELNAHAVPDRVLLLVRDVQTRANRERQIPREDPATT